MGEIYTDVVVSCLTCLDNDSITFGDLKEFMDPDDIVVGVRYIEKVSTWTRRDDLMRIAEKELLDPAYNRADCCINRETGSIYSFP
jgi:hypothetical protein